MRVNCYWTLHPWYYSLCSTINCIIVPQSAIIRELCDDGRADGGFVKLCNKIWKWGTVQTQTKPSELPKSCLCCCENSVYPTHLFPVIRREPETHGAQICYRCYFFFVFFFACVAIVLIYYFRWSHMLICFNCMHLTLVFNWLVQSWCGSLTHLLHQALKVRTVFVCLQCTVMGSVEGLLKKKVQRLQINEDESHRGSTKGRDKSRYKKEWIEQRGMGFCCGQNHNSFTLSWSDLDRTTAKREKQGGRVSGSERKWWVSQGQGW